MDPQVKALLISGGLWWFSSKASAVANTAWLSALIFVIWLAMAMMDHKIFYLTLPQPLFSVLMPVNCPPPPSDFWCFSLSLAWQVYTFNLIHAQQNKLTLHIPKNFTWLHWIELRLFRFSKSSKLLLFYHHKPLKKLLEETCVKEQQLWVSDTIHERIKTRREADLI